MPEDRRWLAGMLAIACALAACSQSRPQAGDSESHFLTSCDLGCGGDLDCVCGVCPRACTQDDACGDLADGATCQATPDDSTCEAAAPARACAVECEDDLACEAVGPEHACSAGRCRVLVGASDAGSGGGSDAAAGEVCLQPVEPFPTFGGRGSEVGGQYLLATDGKALLRFDGESWSELALPVEVDTSSPNALWAAAPDDAFFASGSGVYHLRGDTTQLSLTPAMMAEPAFLDGIHGFSADDVWAVGYTASTCDDCAEPVYAVIYHYDGTSWTRDPSRVEGTLNAIWGAGPDDVWAAGSVLMHWDGNAWSEGGVGGGDSPVIWGRASDEVYRTTASELLRWDGSSWQGVDTGELSVWDVRGVGDEVYALAEGPSLLRWNGERFAETGIDVPDAGVTRLGNFGGELLLLQHESVRRLGADAFEPWIETFDSGNLDGVWSGGRRAFAVRGSELLRFDDHWQVAATLPAELDDVSLYAVDGRAADDLWVVALGYAPDSPRAFHWDGETLEPVALPAPSHLELHDVYVGDAGGVWAVGSDNGEPLDGETDPPPQGPRALRLDGEARDLDLPRDAWLVDGAGGEVFAAGNGLMRWDGSAFVEVDPGVTSDVIDLHVAGPADVYSIERQGDAAVVRHFDGSSSEEVGVPAGYHWRSLDGLEPDDLWLGGATNDGRIALSHFDGDAWKLVAELDAPGTGAVRAVPLGDDRVMVSNSDTTWLYVCPP